MYVRMHVYTLFFYCIILGHYVSMRTSKFRTPGLKAVIMSQSFIASPGQCFTFWYLMHGSTMGNLTLHQRVNESDHFLWIQEGEEGPLWRRALVSLKSGFVNFQVFNTYCSRFQLKRKDVSPGFSHLHYVVSCWIAIWNQW